jgi:CheY-like chemotaxis protein
MGHKLLLADDSVTIQRVIELTFADEDVQVVAVGDGQQAIERAERERPDIVLADVGMPERDGYEVAAFIKGSPTLSHVPVVLLTGAFEPIDETRARAVGCDGVLVKPFEPQMVISRVKDLLAGRRPSGLWGSGPSTQGPVRQATGDLNLRPPAEPAPAAGGGDPLEAYFDRLDAAFTSLGAEPQRDALGGEPKAAAPAPPAGQPARRDPIPLSRPSAAPAPPSPLDDLASWDPDLEGDPARPAPPPVAAPPPARVEAPAAPVPKPIPVAAAPVASQPVAPVPPPPPVAAPVTVAVSATVTPAAAPVAAEPAPTFTPPSLVDAFAALLAAEQKLPVAPSAAPAAPGARAGVPDDRFIEEVTARVLSRLSDQARPEILDVAERLVRDEIERIKRGQ